MEKINSTINLDGCILTFHLVDEAEADHIISYEDEETGEIMEDIDDCEHSKVSVYTNSIRNISIICEQFRFDNEEWFDDTSEIINLIGKEVFDKLVRYINEHDKITIYISQVFETTADFIIYTNTYVTTHQQFIEDVLGTERNMSYKYLIVNNNKTEKFI